ncbi:MAG: PQQ-binding-like beta-propeller repeat protein [Planctomycetaceae bacterium]|jgi:outer membrane protein assembly factor BamB|nr:PQQ-binding-like beta-propeller repeat protein [Planctomycetaceae bacterium]
MQKTRTILGIAVFFCSWSAFAADWHQQGGPNRDYVISAELAGEIRDDFPEGHLTEKWRTNVGFGVAPVICVDGRLYTFGLFKPGTKPEDMDDPESTFTLEYVQQVTSKGTPEEDIFNSRDLPGNAPWEENFRTVRGDEYALCLDAKTGKRIWASLLTDYGLAYRSHHGFDSASPLFIDGRVYFHSPTGRLYCVSAKDGSLEWSVNLFDHGMFHWAERHGNHGSPLYYDGKIIVNFLASRQEDYVKAFQGDWATCQGVAAFDAKTGKREWFTKAPYGGFRPNNSTISFAKIENQPTVLVSLGIGTMGLNPINGEIRWSHQMTPENAPFPYPGLAPAAWKNYVIDTTSVAHDNEPSETRCLKIENGQATLLWKTNEFVPMSEVNKANLLILDGKLYGADAAGGWGEGDPNQKDGNWAYRKFRGKETGQFQCWDIATGKRLWHSAVFRPDTVEPYRWPGEFWASATLYSQGKLIVLNMWGLWVARLNDNGVTLLAHEKGWDSEFMETPVLVDGLMYLRRIDCLRTNGNLVCFDMQKNDAGNAESSSPYRLAKVRLLPKPGSEQDLIGSRIAGSLEGATNAFVGLLTVQKAPAAGEWLELTLDHPEVYRFIKFESASGKKAAVAEIEFYSTVGKMEGNVFGTQVPKEQAEHSHEKAFDGDSNTFFEATVDNSYVGLDLGRDAQAPRPIIESESRIHRESIQVKIRTFPSGSEIHYTLDGTEPMRENALYTNPISLSKTTTLAAKAFQVGKAESETAVMTFRIGEAAVAEPEIRSYHIGNSLTDTINGIFPILANSAGKNLYYMRKTIPGCGIQGNWESNEKGFASPEGWMNNYERVFAEKSVNHLFLQPFPNPPGINSDAEFGGNFIQLARKHNPDVQPWLYAQWSALNWRHDAHCEGAGWMQPPWFPPNRNPETWEEAMANKMLYYHEVFDRWHVLPGNKPVRLCPGGPALVRAKRMLEAEKIPGLDGREFREVFFDDDIHLSKAGRYLIGLVVYACMFEESPVGKVSIVGSGLTADQAAIFQRIAWETVLAEPLAGVAE